MDVAAASGLTVLRFWTNGVTPSYALQQSPGVYNEAMFRGLDYILDEARKHNLKVSHASHLLDDVIANILLVYTVFLEIFSAVYLQRGVLYWKWIIWNILYWKWSFLTEYCRL
jgi:hypothetical protein